MPARLVRVALFVALCAGVGALLFPATIGDQSALAAVVKERPSWAAALRAPDPGIALSPHLAGGITAALGSSPLARRAPPMKGPLLSSPPDRLERALFSPLSGWLDEADESVMPRVAFVVPAPPAPHRSPRAKAAGAPAASERARAVSLSLLSAYAPIEPDLDAPFRVLLGEAPVAKVPHGVSGGGRDHWWSDRPLPKDVAEKASLRCLAQAIYFEARGESETGQRAVAQVVINRVKNPAYPDDVCGVVYQNKTWRNRCQFTFACDRVKDVVRDRPAWALATQIASEYVNGTAWLGEVGAATHYHADYVSPRWASSMRPVKTIDRHIFYITKGGGWT